MPSCLDDEDDTSIVTDGTRDDQRDYNGNIDRILPQLDDAAAVSLAFVCLPDCRTFKTLTNNSRACTHLETRLRHLRARPLHAKRSLATLANASFDLIPPSPLLVRCIKAKAEINKQDRAQ